MPSSPVASAVASAKESASVHLSIPKGVKKLPAFEGLGVEQEVTLHLTGKVQRLSAEGHGRSLGLTIQSLRIEADTSAMSLTEALKKSGERGNG